MASTSDARGADSSRRLRNAATALYSDNQSLITDIRKFLPVMRGLAVDLERENRSHMVKELEDGVAELLGASDDCLHFASAIESVANNYQPGGGLGVFKTLLCVTFEFVIVVSLNSIHQFRCSINVLNTVLQNVHHAGQPMPGDEQEDIVVTGTQTSLLNIICPLSGKPITELGDPVRNMDCKHIYEKMAVMHYIKTKKAQKCPVAGCPKILQAGRVVCDPLLRIEIDEMRSMSHQTGRSIPIEDFTELDEDE
ncbi:hypothetical protein Syun_008575 [Stephania yunnanensis]|uniref:SP-RING-type domain-containing protein n=1 Tax=Stephania yunnanensis TaxID=152371 RepID=A0AAP0PRH3_9MAGN